VEKRTNSDNQSTPHRRADELTRLANQSDDPGARAWYLQWAKAFRRLAAMGEHTSLRRDDN
jgi:hypothetical protein